MRSIVTVTVEPVAGPRLLAPIGIPTPYQTPVRFAVDGGRVEFAGETQTGQMAALITPDPGSPVTLTYAYRNGGAGYPESLFTERKNRFTRAADTLLDDARRMADSATDGHDAIAAIVNDTAQKFTYGHPVSKFNDGLDEIPLLGCGMTEGSCVDINTYLIAALRAAGFEAGYVTGYFFPAEKGGCCEDMHCWVVTRHNGVVLEWDIAHHLKLGTTEICCGLNPKPGARVAIGHSMGLDFPDLGIEAMKLLAEPVWVNGTGDAAPASLTIRLSEAEARQPAA